MRPYVIMKIQIVSAHMVMPTIKDCSHNPSSGPISISIRRSSRSVKCDAMSMFISTMLTLHLCHWKEVTAA